MTAYCTDLADYRWLTGPDAAVVLRDLADCTAGANGEPLHAAAGRLRRSFSARRVHLLLQQAELRRRATAKFASPERLFFTRLGLEQATDQWVAHYKARRFAEAAKRGPLADLCCGIGGDLLALAAAGTVTGVDRDPIATCLAAANTHGGAKLATAEVDGVDACVFAAWHIDPDRRPAGSRTTSLDWSSPNQGAVERLLVAAPHAAMKLAPAADVPAAWAERCELEWISRDRQCRQLVAWHGDLAEAPGVRRATVLSRDGRVVRSVVGQPSRGVSCAGPLDRFLLEPDAALLAAHLSGILADEYGLSTISPGIAYLTGSRAISDPALACFEVEAVLPLKLRVLARHLRTRGIGRLEIKKRGVDYDPEQVRRALKLRGDDSATLILTQLNRKRVAIVARRLQTGDAVASPTPESPILNPPHAARL
jgi:SAM-dependent methyltransferase